MPSVEVVWKGRCVDRQIQQDLCEHLLKLSDLSNRKFKDYFGLQVHTIFFDLPEGETNYLMLDKDFWDHLPSTYIEKVEKGVCLVKKLGLFGVEFPLYDPRNYNLPFGLGTSNRVSFVFTRSQVPELDGQLVQTCAVNKQHRISAYADTVLDNPTLDLRYYLENWMGMFLGWVKHFFMPDLDYWIWQEKAGYRYYEGLEPSMDHRELIFDHLLSAFNEEAVSFSKQLESYLKDKNLDESKRVSKAKGEI